MRGVRHEAAKYLIRNALKLVKATFQTIYSNRHRGSDYADISETRIAREAIKRGGLFTNDRYRVRMEVTPPDVEGGDPHYKIIEVLDLTEAARQGSLRLSKPKGKPKKRL